MFSIKDERDLHIHEAIQILESIQLSKIKPLKYLGVNFEAELLL